ncbi:hypothetical protein J1N35_001963 [Gossypium stocksii]|uniref:Uncharacterized protein n=1 Tax=Gossypium stocksii TaxID=47602 RepID=A0A9D3WJP2_9ROSI|nr:hypothetical protein J1N35_001963 [Gossypium stocksii]
MTDNYNNVVVGLVGEVTNIGDVCMPGAPSNANQDLIELPKGPMTRARTKQLQEALTVLLVCIGDDTKSFDVGEAVDNSLKAQCTLLQTDFSSSPALQAQFSSNQLT